MKYSKRFYGLTAIFAFFITGHVAAKADEQTRAESARANAFFDRVFDETVARSPQFMTQLGMKTDNGKWDDISEARVLEDFILNAQYLAELEGSVTYDHLDEQTKVSYRLFVGDAERHIEGWR